MKNPARHDIFPGKPALKQKTHKACGRAGFLGVAGGGAATPAKLHQLSAFLPLPANVA